jgi:hypothetical protein
MMKNSPLRNTIKFLGVVSLSLTSLLSLVTFAEEESTSFSVEQSNSLDVTEQPLDFYKGRFIISKETDEKNFAGLPGRTFDIVAMPKLETLLPKQPSLTGLKEGWNYNKVHTVKEGAQIFIDKKIVKVEYYKEGVISRTASFDDEKFRGWFYKYDADGEKHGLQIFVDAKYTSIEYYEYGTLVSTSFYRKGRPRGWFYQYEHDQKQGYQFYIQRNENKVAYYEQDQLISEGFYTKGVPSGTFNYYKNDKLDGKQILLKGEDKWKVETFKDGKKEGLFGTFVKNSKEGWHYEYEKGKRITRAYFKENQKIK